MANNGQESLFMDVVMQIDEPATLETKWDWTTIQPSTWTDISTEAVVVSSASRTAAYTVMDNSIANPFGKALHSSDAVMAADLITFMACRSKLIPNDTMWKFIVELNTFGPKLDGICYPDITKMNVTLQYMNYILTVSGAMDRCCNFIDREFQKIHWMSGKNNKGAFNNNKDNQLFSYVETFCIQMSSNYYMVNLDDIQRHTKPSYERVHATIHAKVCYAEIFVQLLQHQLHSIIMLQHSNGTSRDVPDYHALPIVRDILNVKRGVKDILERMTTSCLMIWIQFGVPFVIDAGQLYSKASGDTSTVHLVQQIQRETVRLTELLGIGISYISWIYSHETNEGPYAIADIIGQIYHREMDAAKNKQTLDHKKNKSQSKSLQPPLAMTDIVELEQIVKLRFIASIDKNILPQLRPKLAEQFHVTGAYNILYT